MIIVRAESNNKQCCYDSTALVCSPITLVARYVIERMAIHTLYSFNDTGSVVS